MYEVVFIYAWILQQSYWCNIDHPESRLSFTLDDETQRLILVFRVGLVDDTHMNQLIEL